MNYPVSFHVCSALMSTNTEEPSETCFVVKGGVKCNQTHIIVHIRGKNLPIWRQFRKMKIKNAFSYGLTPYDLVTLHVIMGLGETYFR